MPELNINIEDIPNGTYFVKIISNEEATYKSNKLNISAYFYNENDAKNQPLQQNLSDEQVDILANAGDDKSQMVAPSEIRDELNDNRILYKKEFIGSAEAFVFSNDPDDELYRVTFTLVGDNQGDYNLNNINAINNIYEYVGVNQLSH